MKKITLLFVILFALSLQPTWVLAADSALTINTSPLQSVSAELEEYMSKLSPQVKRKIENGEMPSDGELKKLSPELREELKAVVQRTMADQNDQEGLPAREIFSGISLEIIALILSIIGTVLAVTGFTFANAKKKKSTSRFLNEIDNAYREFKSKSQRCEAELYRLQDVVDDHLKSGKIDESTYHLLSTRIEKYLREIHENLNPSPLPRAAQPVEEEV